MTYMLNEYKIGFNTTTILFLICKISDFGCVHLFWTVLVSWYFQLWLIANKSELCWMRFDFCCRTSDWADVCYTTNDPAYIVVIKSYIYNTHLLFAWYDVQNWTTKMCICKYSLLRQIKIHPFTSINSFPAISIYRFVAYTLYPTVVCIT